MLGRHSFKKGIVGGVCSVCGDKFKGLIKRGMVCSGCKAAVHENCAAMALDSCPATAAGGADVTGRFGLPSGELAPKKKPAAATAAAPAKKKKPAPGGGAADILAGLGLNADDLGLGDDDEDMGDGDGDGDGDLDGDDADLAAQLTVQKPKAKAKQTRPAAAGGGGGGDVDVDKVLAATADDDAADAVEATEDDMNDPTLLGELGELGVPIPDDEPEPEPQPKPQPAPKPKPSPTQHAPALANAQNPHTTQKAKDPREELVRQMEVEKRLYEQLKASGDTQGAIAHGKNVVALKKKLQELDAAAPAPTGHAPAAHRPPSPVAGRVSEKPTPSASAASTHVETTAGAAARRPPSPVAGAPSAAAKKPPSPAPGRRASPTPARRAPQPVEDMEAVRAAKAEKKRLADYETLEAELSEQVKSLQTQAVRAKQGGDMTSAKALLMQSKDVAAQLAVLQKMKTDPARPPLPEVQRETVERKVARSFPDVMPNELLVIVGRAEGLVLADYPQISSYVYCEAQFGESAPITKLQSPVIANNSNPVYNYSAKLPIERNKTLARIFEKKKLVFSIWHRRLMGSVRIGRFEVSCVDLLRKAESVQHCPVLKPESKRPIADGAMVEITLRLREPLLCKEEVTVTEERITIKMPTAPAPAPAPANTQAGPTAQMAPRPATASAASKPAATAPHPPQSTAPAVPKPAAKAPTATATAAAAAAAGGEEMSEQEKLLEEANNVDRLVSNDVLEWEKARVSKLVAAHKAAKKEVPDELTDRLQMIDVKLQMLVVSVQTGGLTQEGYLDMIQKAAAKEKQLALRLNAAGLKDDAKLALQRFKIIEAEIASATAEDGGDE